MLRPVLLLFTLALIGCDTSASPPETGVGDLVLAEAADGYRLTTVADYGCANLPIEVAVVSTAEQLTIRVEGIVDYGVCAPVLGPASVVVPYPAGHGAATARYDVVIEKDGRSDRFVYLCSLVCGLVAADEPSFTRLASSPR